MYLIHLQDKKEIEERNEAERASFLLVSLLDFILLRNVSLCPIYMHYNPLDSILHSFRKVVLIIFDSFSKEKQIIKMYFGKSKLLLGAQETK